MKRSWMVMAGVAAVLVIGLAAVLLFVLPGRQSASTSGKSDSAVAQVAETPSAEAPAASSNAAPDAAPAAPAEAEPADVARVSVVAGPKGIARLSGPQGVKMEAVTGPDGVPVVRLSGVKPESPSGGRPGIFLPIPMPFEHAASGHTVRVDVIARSAADDPSPAFAISYSTADVGNSGWQPFTLTDKLKRYSFTYNVPQMKKGMGDYIGFLSHPAGGKGAVEISEISAEVLPAGTTP